MKNNIHSAIGDLFYMISQWVLNIFKIFVIIWKGGSLIWDESIAVAIAIAFECLSASETHKSNPSPGGNWKKSSTPLEEDLESKLSRNAELLAIASSEAVGFDSFNVSETPESDTISNRLVTHLEKHSELELSENGDEQHSQSELNIYADQFPNASSKAVASECSSVYYTPESSPPPDTTCNKPQTGLDQHSESQLSMNTEDQHSESALRTNTEQFPIASSKSVASDCLSVYGTPEIVPSPDTTCSKQVIPPKHISMSEYNKNKESMGTASELPSSSSESKTSERKESHKANFNRGDFLRSGVSAWSPSVRVFENLDNTQSPHTHSTCNLPSGTPLLYHSISPIHRNVDSLLMTAVSPSARVCNTQLSNRTCNLPFTPPAYQLKSQSSRNGESWSTTSSCLFAGFVKTPDKNQSPETICSLPLTPLAYHSEYRRYAKSSSSIPLSEKTCNLNSLMFKSESKLCRNAEATLFTASFNQNFTCFAFGTDQGIRVYKCDPFQEIFSGYFGHGGISIVEMHYENKTLVLVGSEDNTKCPPDKVIIWDYEFHRCIYELTAKSKVQAVKLTRDHIVLVLEQEVCVYNCMEIEAELLHQIKTLPNPKGLCAVSDMSTNPVLACPGLIKGQVRIEFFVPQKTRFISAHDSHITCLSLSRYGAILATTSTKGTLLRIFNTLDGTCLQEVRRGAKRAEIYSISMSEIAHLLAVCSDKGTVHIFGLNEKVALQERVARKGSNNLNRNGWRGWNVGFSATNLVPVEANTSFSFPFMKGVVPKYFISERSFAQFRFSENVRSLIGFGGHNTIMIVCYDGSFYRCEFDPIHGGEMVQRVNKTFFKSDEPFVVV